MSDASPTPAQGPDLTIPTIPFAIALEDPLPADFFAEWVLDLSRMEMDGSRLFPEKLTIEVGSTDGEWEFYHGSPWQPDHITLPRNSLKVCVVGDLRPTATLRDLLARRDLNLQEERAIVSEGYRIQREADDCRADLQAVTRLGLPRDAVNARRRQVDADCLAHEQRERCSRQELVSWQEQFLAFLEPWTNAIAAPLFARAHAAHPDERKNYILAVRLLEEVGFSSFYVTYPPEPEVSDEASDAPRS